MEKIEYDDALKRKVLKYVRMLASEDKIDHTLGRLESLPSITLDLLSETGIGKAVNSLRKSPEFGERALALVAKWREQAKAQALADGHILVNSSQSQAQSQSSSAAAVKGKRGGEERSMPPPPSKMVMKQEPMEEYSSSSSEELRQRSRVGKTRPPPSPPLRTTTIQHQTAKEKPMVKEEPREEEIEEMDEEDGEEEERAPANVVADRTGYGRVNKIEPAVEEEHEPIKLKVRLSGGGGAGGNGSSGGEILTTKKLDDDGMRLSLKRVKREPAEEMESEVVGFETHIKSNSSSKKRVKAEAPPRPSKDLEIEGNDLFGRKKSKHKKPKREPVEEEDDKEENWASVLSKCGEENGYLRAAETLSSMKTKRESAAGAGGGKSGGNGKNNSMSSTTLQLYEPSPVDDEDLFAAELSSLSSAANRGGFKEKIKRNLPEIKVSDVSSDSMAQHYRSLPAAVARNPSQLADTLRNTGSSINGFRISKSSDQSLGEFLDPTIARAKSRTALYAGRKKKSRPFCPQRASNQQHYEIPSLFDLCIKTAIQNIDASVDVVFPQYIPFYVVRPVLERCSHSQLARIERKNPYLREDTGELWKRHCEREFPGHPALLLSTDSSNGGTDGGKGDSDLEHHKRATNWRRKFKMLCDERNRRLAAVSARIHANTAISNAPQRVTKEIGMVTPHAIRRRQIRNGIKIQPSEMPSAVEISRSRRHVFETGGDRSELRTIPAGIRGSGNAPSTSSRDSGGGGGMRRPVAPLMAKTLKMVKNMRH